LILIYLKYAKRIDLLINAFKIIYDRIKDTVLIIGGIGPDEKNLKALVKKLNIQDRVKFVGYIKEEELWDYLLACDVFVHPIKNKDLLVLCAFVPT